MERNNFYWLDLMRGIASILVFLSHIRILFFLDYPEVIHNDVSKIFYFITGFGHSSVVIFFVLSGFFIIRSIDEKLTNNKWDFGTYLIDRLSRLWIVLLPALILTYILDKVGITCFPSAIAYQGKIESLNFDLLKSSTIYCFVGNTFFLQGIKVPSYGSNLPLWSLSYEFWYYIIFPLLFIALFRIYNIHFRLMFVTIALLLSIFVGEKIMLSFIIWLMGGVCYYVYKRTKYIHYSFYFKFLFMALYLIFVGIVRLKILENVFNDYTLAIMTLILILVLIKTDMNNIFIKKISMGLSNFSFSLYVFHMPISVFITSFFLKTRVEFTPINFMLFLLINFLILFIVYLLWYAFEKRTSQIRYWLKVKIQ